MNGDILVKIFGYLNLQFVKNRLSIVNKDFANIIEKMKFVDVNLSNFKLKIDLNKLVNLTSLNLGENKIITDQGVENLINLTSVNPGRNKT